jgi:hypothetical protein
MARWVDGPPLMSSVHLAKLNMGRARRLQALIAPGHGYQPRQISHDDGCCSVM